MVWIHGDLQAANLLIYRGKLYDVIDFGCLGVGDPACDVMAAWTCVPAELRDVSEPSWPLMMGPGSEVAVGPCPSG